MLARKKIAIALIYLLLDQSTFLAGQFLVVLNTTDLSFVYKKVEF
jgi:hypothetical protein